MPLMLHELASDPSFRWDDETGLSLQLDVPVEPVAPGFVQVVRRELLAVLLQLPAGRADRMHQRVHARLLGRAAALLHVTRGAGGEDVLPRRASAEPAGLDVVESQVLLAAAVLAAEAVAQEHVEAGERRELARADILS